MSSTPPNMQRCPKCGASNPAEADWCSQCLERFSEPSPQAPAAEPAATAPAPAGAPAPRAPERKKLTGGQIVGAVLVVMLCVAGLATVGFYVLVSIAMLSFGSNK